MKEESPENIAAKEAEKVMRRFWRGVKVENGKEGELFEVLLTSWSSISGFDDFVSSLEAMVEC